MSLLLLVSNPNLVSNGTFDSGTSPWIAGGTASLSIVGGKLRITAVSGFDYAYLNIGGTTVGQGYRLKLDIDPATSGNIGVKMGFGALDTSTSSTVVTTLQTGYTVNFVAGYATTVLTIQLLDGNAGRITEIDNVSVVPLPGIVAAVGSYVITGTAVGLVSQRKLTATPGSYSITGTPLSFIPTRRLVVVPGSYALTGTATALRTTRRQVEAVGSYSISGQAVALRRGFSMAATPGSYAITGTATGLRIARRLAVVPGAYALTGTAAGLGTARRLTASPGAYAYNGQTVGLTYAPASGGAVLNATSGTYTLTGGVIALRIARKLIAARGSYRITGYPAVLVYNSIWVPSEGPATDYTIDEPEAGTWTVVPPPTPAFVNTEQATATWNDQTPGTWQ